MSAGCDFCGNDEATVHACLDCLGYKPPALAQGLSVVLGGTPDVWRSVANALHDALEGNTR